MRTTLFLILITGAISLEGLSAGFHESKACQRILQQINLANQMLALFAPNNNEVKDENQEILSRAGRLHVLDLLAVRAEKWNKSASRALSILTRQSSEEMAILEIKKDQRLVKFLDRFLGEPTNFIHVQVNNLSAVLSIHAEQLRRRHIFFQKLIDKVLKCDQIGQTSVEDRNLASDEVQSEWVTSATAIPLVTHEQFQVAWEDSATFLMAKPKLSPGLQLVLQDERAFLLFLSGTDFGKTALFRRNFIAIVDSLRQIRQER